MATPTLIHLPKPALLATTTAATVAASPSFHSLLFTSKSPFNPKLHHFYKPHLALSVLSPSKTQTLLPLDTKDDCFFEVDTDHVLNLLKISVKYSDLELLQAVHASIVKLGDDTYLGNSLILAYIKIGFVVDAFKVFKGMNNPDVVSFSALISCFAKGKNEKKSFELFFRMRSLEILPNEFSFVGVLTACIRILELDLGYQIHGLLVKMGFLECDFVVNALMSLYGKCGVLDYVVQLFDEMPERDVATWNTVMSSLVNELEFENALDLFRDFCISTGFRADPFTLSTVLNACAGSSARMGGREAHAHAIRLGFDGNLIVNNAIIKLYTVCGSLKDVVSVFDRMPEKDVITWTEMIVAYMEFGCVDLAVKIFEKMFERNSVSYNAMLAGFCKNGEGLKALEFFIKMVWEGVELTDFTLTSILNACGILMDFEFSRQIHGFIIKFGVGENACIETALLDMYTMCSRMNDASKMLHKWPSSQDSSIARTSMICGYARNGMPEKAISLFQRCISEGTLVVDEVTLASVLGVCGTLGFLEMGEQIHCYALKTGFITNIEVGNAIISMYSKCFKINQAIKFFNNMEAYDIVSWNCLIAGHLLHRQGDEALAVWSWMMSEGIKPDSVTFVLIISAYSHTTAYLVEDCRILFSSMKEVYEVEPTSEHYSCFVSVLGCWGLLEVAEDVIIHMPFKPGVSVWRALLNSCRLHVNTTIGKRAAKHILAVEPQDPPTYSLVSNLYSASARWHCSDMVRANMREKGIRKHPCRSWMVHQKEVHSFYVRDKSHPQVKDIYAGLDVLILECLKAGYEPDTSFVLHEVEEYQKKDFLFYHSAKLAATYGLLATKPGEVVRIVKNILVCGDCHAFLKHVSAVTGREILLRDTSGFHHFSNGECSCKDYWQ